MALDDLDSAINIATGEVTQSNDDPLSRLDLAIDDVVSVKRKRAATVTGIASQYNADQIAQSRNLGRQLGLPDGVAERNPDEVRRKFISKKVEELYDTSPVAGRKLADPEFAKLTHDITDELRGNEEAIKQLALSKQGFRAASELSRAMSDVDFKDKVTRAKERPLDRGLGDVVGGFGRSIAAGVGPRVGQGVYGMMAAPFGALAPLLDPLVGAILPINPLRSTEQGLLGLSKSQSNIAESISGDKSEQGFAEKSFNSGFESLGMNLPPLVAGTITNNPSLALNAMVAIAGGQEYARAREQGLDANQALVYAGSQAAIEWATEKIPVDTLFKGLRGESGLLKTLLLSNVQEQIGEQAATVLQDLNEWAALNPDKPFSEYLAERPEAALQTAIATLVGTTGQVAIAKSIEVAGNYVSTEQEKLQYQSEMANKSTQAFTNIQQLSAQSKLKERSAQDFATFLQEAGAENGIEEVFVDARAFASEAEKQGVDLNTLMQSSPAINQQLANAIAQGVDLVIPVGEFGSNIAGTDFGASILQHLRADENGISAFEAKTQLDGAVEELQKQAKQVSQQHQDNEAWTQSINQVSETLLGQLNAVGRFAPDANQAYVRGLVAPWYSILAGNLGVTPSEAYARYPLQVSGNITSDGFDQAEGNALGKNEALSSLSSLSGVVYDKTFTPKEAYEALFEAANTKQKKVLRALSKEQMLGFEYPHQALEALMKNPAAYEASPLFKSLLTKARNNRFNQAEQLRPELRGLIDAAESKSNENITVTIGEVASWEITEAKNNADIDLQGYKHTADMYAVRHTLKRHSDAKIEFSRGQLPITESDIEQIPSAVLSPDAVVYGIKNERKQDVIASIHKMQDGSLLVVEEVRIGRKTLALASARKYPSAKDYDSIARTLLSNAQSDKGDKLSIVNRSYEVNDGDTFYQSEYNGAYGYTHDLFGNSLPHAGGRVGVGKNAHVTSGEAIPEVSQQGLQDTQAPDAEYYVNTIVGTEFNKKLGAPNIKSSLHLAQATHYLNESPVERFDGIVTNQDGTPLAVIGGFKGAVTSASVYTPTLIAEAMRIKGAAYLWLSHNHPSGHAELSTSDINLYNTVKGAFDGSGIEVKGLIAVARGEYASIDADGVNGFQETKESTSSITVPVVERTLKDDGTRHGELSSPDAAKLMAKAFYEKASSAGIILLDVRNRVIAWLPVSDNLSGNLKNTGGLANLYRAISQSNAVNAIIVHDGRLGVSAFPNGQNAIENIGRALQNAEVRLLDAFNINDNKTYVEAGKNLIGGELYQKAEQKARGQISFGSDITQGANITLLKNADASTFIHELGHFFLEVYADVASKPDAPQSIVDDMNQLLNWFGIESTEQPAMDVWRNMTLEQKRPYHEQLARGFEQYAMEGKAPTVELSRVFAKLRSFMLSAYKSLKQFFERSGNPGLSKEVRQVFDRMLASDEAISRAEAVRGMMPMFASMEEAGMSVKEYAEYLQNQQDATDEAKAELTARSLRDMKWLQGARSRILRDLQRQADTERRAVRMAVRSEVMKQPVYQAYAWLKQIPDETKAQQAEKVKATRGVDVEKDSLYTAIAKLGGLNRALVASEWGLDPKDRFDSGVFGKPVLRKEGGLSIDEMAEALSQYEYLTIDENGKWDLHEFEDKFFEEAGGEKQYSLFAEGEQYRKWQESIYDEQERVRLDAFGKGKLDLAMMRGMYGEDGDWRNLGIGRTGMVMQTGSPPDAVAELFGFNSGDHLVKSLLAAENPKAIIERLTDERMLSEFGDLVDAKRMNEAADKAVHNEIRARVLATELSAQNKALGNRRVLEAAAKEHANRQVMATIVRDLKPSKYVRAESRAAQTSEKATRKGDTQTAVQAKRDQLLNNRAAKSTIEAIEKIEATLKYLKKFNSEGVRKSLDIEYIEQIDDVLNRFDLRTGQSLRAIDKRKSLVQWVESQKEQGLSPVIDEDLLNEARRISYKNLSYEQFMALTDSVRNIEHLGRLKKTLLTAKDRREFSERMAEARESINGNANRMVPERATPNDFLGKASKWGRRMMAAHRKFSSFMRELDGGKDLGVMSDMLLYSMYEAGSLETDLRAKSAEDMQRLLDTIEGKIDRGVGNLYAIKRLVPGTNISLTHEQRIMFAMNWGNEGNRQRLLDGGLEGTRSINNEDAAAILDTITKEEWDFIQGTWDYIATFRPMIAEQERRLTGREPVWIEPSLVNTKFGAYAGGYFPAKYDAQMSTRSESLEAVTDLRIAMKGAFNTSATRDGYTQSRANAVKGRPILLSFDTISRHIHEVTHRLAWQEWLTDATRVINALDGDIRERLGAEALQEIHQHIRDVAVGDAPVTGTTDVLLSRIRAGSSIVGMGYRVSTALLQPSGIFQSWARLGIHAIANGVKTVLKNPVKTHEWVMENSPMMRNRARTLNREINEIVNQVRAGKKLTTLQASYFYMISKMQIMIDIPTYVGAYEKALFDLDYDKAGSEDDRKAIETKAHSFAGQTVIDTQTGGEIKDLAGVQKGSQGQKLFTNFYSYFSALYNLNVENFRSKKLTNPAEFADFVATALLLNVMPVIYSVALKNVLKGECDWGDAECLLQRYKSEQMSAVFGQMIGGHDVGVAVDVATGGNAYGYSGPPSLRFFSDIYKVGQQAEQGEIDMPLFKSLNSASGILFHYPAGQINSTTEGILAIERGEVDGLSIFGALISGPPKD